MNLPEGSISSWVDLCHQFVGAYQGGHKVPGQPSDLHVLPQRDGESLRKYIQRFSRVHHNIPDVHPAAVIAAFHTNVKNRQDAGGDEHHQGERYRRAVCSGRQVCAC